LGDHADADPLERCDPTPHRDEAVNQAISELQAELADWKVASIDLGKWIRTVREWADDLWTSFISAEAVGSVAVRRPQFLFCFRPERAHVLGHYVPGRNDAGLRFELSLNPRHLRARSEVQIAATLLHELLHAYEHLIHRAPTAGNGYHSAWFRKKAQALGIPCSRFGRDMGIRPRSPFADWARSRGLDLELQAAPLTQSDGEIHQVREKRRTWICGCPSSVRVIVLVARGARLRARCESCDQLYRPRE